MATAPRATGARPPLTLTPAERATIAVELARLSAQAAALAARLDRLQAALATSREPARVTPTIAAPITRTLAVRAGAV
jgi:ethanolamine utilization microcompartment shell protein EutS